MKRKKNLRRGFLIPVVAVLSLFTTILLPMQNAFAAIPTVTGFSPTSGGVGTRVIITGTNFSGTCTTTAVQFGPTAAASFTVNSATQITATVSTGSNGKIKVTATGTGCTSGTSAANFTWTATTYTVTYDGNGKTSGMVAVDGTTPYASGGTVTVLGNTGGLVRIGYVFTNWNTAANGSGTSYSAGNTFAIGANTILYAQWAITYTVTYSGNGDTGGSVPVDGSSPYASGATVTVLGNAGSLVKTGSTFDNWNTAANGSGTSYAPTNTFSIAANTILYAVWRAAVTYNANGATGGSVPVDGSSPYLTGATTAVLGNTGSLVKTGGSFAGWNTAANGLGTTYVGGNSFTVTADTVLYAQWTSITYTVTYNGNTNTGGMVPVDGSSPYVSGGTVTVLGNTMMLVKTGYIFAGWNTAANGLGTPYAPAATFTIAANTTLYAQWTTTYTVTYNGNGRTGGAVPVDSSSPYVGGATVTVLENTGSIVRTGSTFAGWNTMADASGTTYAPGETFTVNSNTILYAVWKVAVTYDGNGSTGGIVPVDGSSPYLTSATATVLGNTGALVKTGSSFAGWNTAANGTGTIYVAGNSFAVTASTVLYAQWTPTYTLVYAGNGSTGGTVPVDSSSPYINGHNVTVLGNTGSLVKTGFTFSHWNTAANGTGLPYSPDDVFPIGTNTVLYAQWTALGSYSVIYDGNGSTGGTVPVDGSSPYINGATVTVLGNTGSLIRTGSTFASWNTAANGSGISYTSGNTFNIASHVTLYAQWSALSTATVTYNANGATSGTVPVDTSSPYVDGASVTVKSNSGVLAKVHSSFTGWNTEPNGLGATYAPAATFTIGTNTVLYAQWTTSYTVIYRTGFSTSGVVPVDALSPYASGATVTVLENTGSLVRPNLTFDGWNTLIDGLGTPYAPGATFVITADTLLFAQWRATLTYNANGATGGTIPVDKFSPYLSPYQTPPTVTVLGNTGSLVRTDYTFAHWCTTSDNSGQHYVADETFVLAANTILYAIWTATVTYNANGATSGSVPVDASTPYVDGASVTVKSNSGVLAKVGFSFTGWNTEPDGLGATYAPAATFTIGTNTVLYAQWVTTYTVAYSGHGETGGSSPIDGSSPYASGATVNVSGNTGSLVKTGSVFSHWNTAPNGSGTSYSPGNTFTIGSNTVLYAQWRATVTYNGDGSTGGSPPNDGSSPYLDGAVVTVLGNTGSLVRAGYTFVHWGTGPNNTGEHFQVGDQFIITQNTTFYAHWELIGTHNVVYNDNGATGGTIPIDPSNPYATGSSVTVLGNTGSLVKSGSIFEGWNTVDDESGIDYRPGDQFVINATTILYAEWASEIYAVSYNSNGATSGTVPVDDGGPYDGGDVVMILSNSGALSRTGYTFAGWNTAADGSGTTYDATGQAIFTIAGDTILYAQWSIVAPPVPPATSLPPIATIEMPVTELVRANETADTVVYATILGLGGTPFIVSVTIPAGAISRDITISITPASTPAEISSGFIIIRVTATDSSGVSVTQFDKPLIINLGHVNAGASVVFSQDEIAWTPIQLLSGVALPDGMQEGYYVAVDDDTIILTRHLMYFGVKKPQVRLRVLSSAYILKVGESATLTAIGGSGSGVIGYVTTTPSICSVLDAGSVTALTAGVCIIEAMKSGDATYLNVLSLPLNLTIQKLVQAPFTLISSADILSVGGSSTLTTSGGSGDGAIKFSTTTPTYCSVSDAGLVRALVSGNCIVEATKAGNGTYLEVSSWLLYLSIERVLSVPAPIPGATEIGGVLPKTGSPWYNLLASGIGLILLGGVGWARRKRSKAYSASST